MKKQTKKKLICGTKAWVIVNNLWSIDIKEILLLAFIFFF